MSLDQLHLPGLDEASLVQCARQLAPRLRAGGSLHLTGELGAGKTTFARALLHALGVGERVKSPTYSLIESYAAGPLRVHHLDLYRIADPGELEWLGLAEMCSPDALVVVEWPERGGSTIGVPDLVIALGHADGTRDLEATARSPVGRGWLESWR